MAAEQEKPFCSKGCKHAYEHETRCIQPTTYSPAEHPDVYASLSNEKLFEVYDSLLADYHRYGHPMTGEYHRPTWEEAARRAKLAQAVMLSRMAKGV